MTTTNNISNMGTTSAIFNALASAKGYQFVGITYITEVKMNKSGNPYYGRVTKRTKVQVDFNGVYQNKVNNSIGRNLGVEGEFVTSPLPYGKWMVGLVNKFYEHKGEIYLRLYEHKGAVAHVTYYLDGVEIGEREMENLRPHLPKNSWYSKKQAEMGLSKSEMVKPYGVKLKNVESITLNGVTYTK
jgi:hypothetical protein